MNIHQKEKYLSKIHMIGEKIFTITANDDDDELQKILDIIEKRYLGLIEYYDDTGFYDDTLDNYKMVCISIYLILGKYYLGYDKTNIVDYMTVFSNHFKLDITELNSMEMKIFVDLVFINYKF